MSIMSNVILGALKVSTVEGNEVIFRGEAWNRNIGELLTEGDLNILKNDVPYIATLLDGGTCVRHGVFVVEEDNTVGAIKFRACIRGNTHYWTVELDSIKVPVLIEISRFSKVEFPVTIKHQTLKSCMGAYTIQTKEQLLEFLDEIEGDFAVRSSTGIDIIGEYVKPKVTRKVIYTELFCS